MLKRLQLSTPQPPLVKATDMGRDYLASYMAGDTQWLQNNLAQKVTLVCQTILSGCETDTRERAGKKAVVKCYSRDLFPTIRGCHLMQLAWEYTDPHNVNMSCITQRGPYGDQVNYRIQLGFEKEYGKLKIAKIEQVQWITKR